MKKRKDVWKPEEDKLLKETVLEYTSNGDSKASAFKKASTELGRTVSACRYRWNAVISKKTDKETNENSSRNSEIQIYETPGAVPPENLAQVIQFLRNFAKTKSRSVHLMENKRLHEEQKDLKLQNKQLIRKLQEKEVEYANQFLQYEEMARILKEADQLLKQDSVEEKKAVH
ncbi:MULTISPECIES: hypothetical protein [Cytobacillus]|uniref:hypothetical protein n=1 Tax=Cytobacillus TaxID=2675230 RepID=UPI00203E4513|nr:hypothetical protein [Cytobacillus firmus]MCM3708492.1 hypothetical protein [Cytobacillus firmus]